MTNNYVPVIFYSIWSSKTVIFVRTSHIHTFKFVLVSPKRPLPKKSVGGAHATELYTF